MLDLLRGTPTGDALRFLSHRRFPRYREDDADFPLSRVFPAAKDEAKQQGVFDFTPPRSEPVDPLASPPCDLEANTYPPSPATTLCETSSNAVILVEWYSADDAENPLNWSLRKKLWTSACISSATVSIYMGGATITAAFQSLTEEFGLEHQVVVLGMSLYIFFYGAGALLFSPLSELPQVGRNPPYYLPMALALLIQLAGALSPTYPGVLISRALVGLLGAPLLATGGASLCDVWGIRRLPVVLNWCWVFPSFCAPGFAPILTASAVNLFGWRWSFWIQLFWMAAALILLLLSPETAADNILYRRAVRLRRLTGNAAYKAAAEIASQHTSTTDLLYEALAVPFKITLLDPSILFCNCYIGLCYGLFFTFFDAFPIVFTEIFSFGAYTQHLPYLCAVVGGFISAVFYTLYQKLYMMPLVEREGMPVVERRLEPALVSSVGAPIGLFIFAWSSFAHLHWIGPVIGASLFVASNLITFQCLFYYVILAYERYAASALAANDFVRSAIAAFLLHAATPLFRSPLGVHGGVTLVGGVACLGIVGVWVLYLFGHRLRARSRFTPPVALDAGEKAGAASQA